MKEFEISCIFFGIGLFILIIYLKKTNKNDKNN